VLGTIRTRKSLLTMATPYAPHYDFVDCSNIDEQIRFIEQRVEIWNGSTPLHNKMREMYGSILFSLIQLKSEQQKGHVFP